eukprot:1187770-Prorocentrum_minimum.AAC.5
MREYAHLPLYSASALSECQVHGRGGCGGNKHVRTARSDHQRPRNQNHAHFSSTHSFGGGFSCTRVAISQTRHLAKRRDRRGEALLSLRDIYTSRPAAHVVSCEASDDHSEERQTRNSFLQAPKHETLETYVVGVTHDNRQEIVASLRVGEPLLLTREPENQFDVNAVVVTRLSGDTVGYISRDLTYEFQADVTVGRVVSTGQNAKGLYGVRVACTPGRASLYVDLIPQSLRGTNLSAELPTSKW